VRRVQGIPLNTLVLGPGNALFGDKVIGVHGIWRYKSVLRSWCRDISGGRKTGFCFGSPIEEADNLILIHAARLDTSPGFIRRVSLTFRRYCPNTAQDMQ
jgi:Ni,Fe-hydrogenase maturation factor